MTHINQLMNSLTHSALNIYLEIRISSCSNLGKAVVE